jgi:hypothetical protein
MDRGLQERARAHAAWAEDERRNANTWRVKAQALLRENEKLEAEVGEMLNEIDEWQDRCRVEIVWAAGASDETRSVYDTPLEIVLPPWELLCPHCNTDEEARAA